MSIAPPLTIAVPVYDGQNDLSESLNSQPAETYPDLELIIFDINVSVGGTEATCRHYAVRGNRYFHDQVKIGATRSAIGSVEVPRSRA
jgi:hypothetical protein